MKKILSLLLLLPLFTFSQNVGISSNILFNPQYTLDVDGITKISNYASIGVSPNASYRLYVYNSSNNYARLGSSQYGLYARGSSSAVWGLNSTVGGHAVRAEQTSTGYSIYADGINSRNYFQGNVGVGSLSPNSKLEVIGSASGQIESAIFGELDITDGEGIGVVGVGGYNGVQGNVFPLGNQTYYGASGNVISTSGIGTNIGIYGRAEGGGTNYAGYFLGDVLVTGLSGGGIKSVAADNNGLLRSTNGIGTAPITECTTTTTTTTSQVSGVVQVGTATTTTAASGESPFSTLYHDQRTQYVFTAAELTAAGLVAGNITAIAFNITSTGSPSMANFNIRMGHTANVDASSPWITGLTTVRSINPWNPSTGWQTIALTTAFNWNGTSNLAIEICFDNTTWSSNFGIQFTAATNMVYNRYADGLSGCSMASNAGNLGSSSRRANIRFTGQTNVTNTVSTTTCVDVNKLQRIIRGNVNNDASISSGGGFTCTRPSTGIYLVTFVQAFSDAPTVVATQVGSGDTRDNALVYDITSTSFRVKVGDSGGIVSNRPFTFIAMGSE